MNRPPVRIAAALALAILLAHAWHYRFLTDDAYISFRYARNLAEGHGLVFNAGHERVEGYTNFLWVVLLAALDRAGLAPERAANALSLLCGAAIVIALARFLASESRPGGRMAGRAAWILVLPLFLLAATRSFAVWCTSGLETKLFEMLVVLGVLRAIAEVDAARRRERDSWVVSSVLLALASLTRPDGALVALCVLAARFALEGRRGARIGRAALAGVAAFAALAGGHLAFRLAYYGDWVPNTYHAKVGGATWLSMGLRYAGAFAIEYGAILWVPLLVAAAFQLARERRSHHGALMAAAVVPHAASVLVIGGDHFEYRPLDLCFPFLFLLIADGAAYLTARGRGAARLAIALVVVLGVNVVAVPLLGRAGFPRDYRPGFPGSTARIDGTRDLISADRFAALLAVPVVAQALSLYNTLIEETTSHAVGIRQEEHALFLPEVEPEGRRLAALVADGLLPADTHIAIGSVGALPYGSRLRTLDRQGLTDRIVARGAARPDARRLMAHNKLASFEDAAARGVDLWACDGTHLLFGPDEERLQSFVATAQTHGALLVAGNAGPDEVLIAEFPGTPEQLAQRLPRLSPAGEFFAREAARADAPWWMHAHLGDWLAAGGDFAAAALAFERAIAINPEAARAYSHAGAALLRLNDPQRALPHLQEALRLDPHNPSVRADLVQAHARLGDFAGAMQMLRAHVEALPRDTGLSAMLARFLATSPDPALRDPEEAVRIAERLRRQTRGQDVHVLDTLGSAYAAAKRFPDARATALAAQTRALAIGDSTRAAEIAERARAYAAGREYWPGER